MDFVLAVVALLLLRSGIAAADLPFVTSNSPLGIRLNETASLTCNYSGLALVFGDTVEWWKDGALIVSQSTVMPGSLGTAFRVAFGATSSVVNVTGVSLAVGGTYTCMVTKKSCSPSDDTCRSLEASQYLPVYGPPLAIAWQGAVAAPGGGGGGSQIELQTFDESRPLIFDVYGLYNVSSFVSVTLGGRNVTGEFTPAAVASGAGLSVYNVSFTSSASLSQSAADGDILNATVAVPLYPPMSATVTLAVAAKPNVSCPSELQSAQGDNVRIACTVHSNPPAMSFNWTTSGSTFLSGNGTLYDGRITSLVIEEGRNRYYVTLDILNASNADRAVYSLEVTNLMGISRNDVRLVPGVAAKTTQGTSSSDSHIYPQWIVLFAAAVIHAAVQQGI